MNSPSALVSAIGGDIGISVARSLKRSGAIVLGCDSCRVRFPDDCLDKVFTVPFAAQTSAYITALQEILKTEKIDFFIPVSEPEIELVNTNREAIGSCGAKLVINNPLIIEQFLDKYHTAKFLKTIGIATPQTFLLRDFADQLELPVIVKPRRGCGSKGNILATEPIDIDYQRAKDSGDLIVQEYIGTPDQEYTTGIFADGKTISVISFKRRLGLGGLSIEAELADNPTLTAMAHRIAAATDLVGSINLQTRRVANRFIPFEINPRFSSTLAFRENFGFRDASWWLGALAGTPHTYRPKYKRGFARRVIASAYYNLEKTDS